MFIFILRIFIFMIIYLQVRKYPQYMLCLQNGRFDHPDRMFNSVKDVYNNCLRNMSDFKVILVPVQAGIVNTLLLISLLNNDSYIQLRINLFIVLLITPLSLVDI